MATIIFFYKAEAASLSYVDQTARRIKESSQPVECNQVALSEQVML